MIFSNFSWFLVNGYYFIKFMIEYNKYLSKYRLKIGWKRKKSFLSWDKTNNENKDKHWEDWARSNLKDISDFYSKYESFPSYCHQKKILLNSCSEMSQKLTSLYLPSFSFLNDLSPLYLMTLLNIPHNLFHLISHSISSSFFNNSILYHLTLDNSQ